MAKNFDATYKNATLPEGKKEQLISDNIDNLYMRLRSGKDEVRKSWQFNYHHPLTKKRIKLTLGSYPALSLTDARKKAISYHELLEKNIDPQEYERTGGINAIDPDKRLFKDVAEEWFESKILAEDKNKRQEKIDDANKRAKDEGRGKASDQEIEAVLRDLRYSKDMRGRLDNHILPALGNMPVTEMKTYLVKNALQPSYARGINMDKICQITTRIMRFAKTMDYIEANPIDDLSEVFVNKRKQKQPSIKPEGLSELMKAMGERNITKVTRAGFEMQMHTLARASEIAKMRWDEVDFENNLIKIPSYRMKRLNEHFIPLTKYTRGLLEYLKPFSSHLEYVFPADPRSSRPHMNQQSINANLKRAGFKDELVSHGFRHMGSTFLNDSKKYGANEKFDADVIEACLAHCDDDKIREIYNSAEYIEMRREILEFWGDYIVEQTANYHSIAARFK
ncbi:tyrosine-type recombinase/integrase [Vibrio parahaemolyticus]|uniref:tyrosine-type recombinase/integrase n=2 Tax=Vibrionaceae TaxID=641 RepID=UPI00042112ED|nr:tyrosine-type recombinase/integrase [Vibrio parahaemolyticus]HDY7995804.1 tyrosine-type recombinase/integrase [Vibrio vulnificus]ELA8113667.1 tyrosine-type recombinase/integrase [Vibrio parahaemolyticus]ELA8165570.1 tyrosine-type recombinase/integrase [Vibrio parahaemolyticus]ELA8167563.1 tyrosine-type recombinase/integrase [Vibrio parahaemolyticus]